MQAKLWRPILSNIYNKMLVSRDEYNGKYALQVKIIIICFRFYASPIYLLIQHIKDEQDTKALPEV